MTKLSEIETAYREGNYTRGDSLSSQWYRERGIVVTSGDKPQAVVMRYIERLEMDRRYLLESVSQLLPLASAVTGYEQRIVGKSKDLIAVLAQHEREEAR